MVHAQLARTATWSAAAAALAAFAWWATGLRPFAGTTAAAIVASGAVAMAIGAARRPSGRPQGALVGWVGWAALFTALAAWQLLAYFQHPRAEHPTLSSLANSLLDDHPTRALAFAAWLLAGALLARR